MAMPSNLSMLPPRIETTADLRELYRAAEARAARLRLLSVSGRELALSDAASLPNVLQACTERLAYFVGGRSGTCVIGTDRPDENCLAVPSPGFDGASIATICIEGVANLSDVKDPEDRDAVRMLLELMGVTIHRLKREEERARLLHALREREQRLEQLVERVFTAQEDERRRVSHDLHDGVAQTAAALSRLLEGTSSAGGRDLPVAERKRLASIARTLVTELRAVIAGLRPTVLDDLGLAAALQALADGLQRDGYRVSICLPREPQGWPPHVETALYRVAQEAITNIRKHAGGSCAVSVRLWTKDNCACLRISDEGRGSAIHTLGEPVGGEGTHVGLQVMRERMAMIGGTLSWIGNSSGVTVTASTGKP